MSQSLAHIEELRKRALKHLCIWAGVLIVAILFFMAGMSGGAVFLVYPAVLLFAVGLIGLFAFYFKASKAFTDAFKADVVRASLTNVFDDVAFDPDSGFEQEVLENTEMITMGNRYHSDDYVSGSYSGVRFERADVRIQQVTSTGKTTTTVTYFEGPWMIFDFNKDFRCDLQVREKGFSAAKKTGGWFSSKPKMHRLELEDARFNDHFSVYAVDEQEAYYILTPHMMESILELKQHTSGEMLLCFCQNRLHIGVDSRENAFEPSLWGPVDEKNVMGNVLEDIRAITSFVDQLKLGRNIFK